MSLREEDKQNKNCPSRGLGLGLAAAAIGVGVGAALYYFISKRPENPNSAGSTQHWEYDPDNTLNESPSTTTTQVFRQRTWSLEECSICCEVILRDQEVMSLPCTHHFHTKCILPWLQEQQTCPNCRKSVD